MSIDRDKLRIQTLFNCPLTGFRPNQYPTNGSDASRCQIINQVYNREKTANIFNVLHLGSGFENSVSTLVIRKF